MLWQDKLVVGGAAFWGDYFVRSAQSASVVVAAKVRRVRDHMSRSAQSASVVIAPKVRRVQENVKFSWENDRASWVCGVAVCLGSVAAGVLIAQLVS
jgi:hypothetical protein